MIRPHIFISEGFKTKNDIAPLTKLLWVLWCACQKKFKYLIVLEMFCKFVN
jgi:hypothetical protein